MTGLLVRCIASTCAGLALAGCGGPVPSAAPAEQALPPRPYELRIDGLHPCSLLTADQRRTLGVFNGIDGGVLQTGLNQGPSCVWLNGPGTRANSYGATLVTNHNTAAWPSSEPVRLVDGYGARTGLAPGDNPNYECGLMVDIAPDRALYASYGNDTKDIPGMSRQVACANAQRLAEYLLTNLKAQRGR
jgi:hypothetical protein